MHVSLDDKLLAEALRVAENRGTTIDELVRSFLERLIQEDLEEELAELDRLSGQGDSQGWKFNRDEIHERK